jgi:hypothetical protein
LLIVALAAGACDNRFRRLNAPPQGESDHPSELQPFFNTMVCQAALSDMSVADIHFVAHSSELNGTGTYRLDRLAPLLETYGGTVRYDTSLTDSKLVQERIAHVREYLATTGIDTKRVDVQVMLPGGEGMSGKEAVKALQQGTADKSKGAKSSTMEAGAAGGAGEGSSRGGQ